MIYLDNAATTPAKPECVRRAVYEAMGNMGNSGRGCYGPAIETSRVIYGVRERIAEFFGAEDPSGVVFTCNATEALNIVIRGILEKGDHVITTEMEHNSVLRPLYEKEKEGVALTILPVNEKGNIALGELESAIREDTKAVICTHASNVTGNLNDINAIGSICRRHNILFVLDASQSAGSIPVNMAASHVDILCFTGHKSMMGPQGTGGICVRNRVEIRALKSGGSGVHSFEKSHPLMMPERLEAGTLNGHGIAGLGCAVQYIEELGVEKIWEHERALMSVFYGSVKEIPGVTVYGDFSTEKRAAIVSLNIEGYDSAMVSDELAHDYEIYTRPGAHCAPLMHKALGTEEQGAVRFSFSWFNTMDEAKAAARAVRALASV